MAGFIPIEVTEVSLDDEELLREFWIQLRAEEYDREWKAGTTDGWDGPFIEGQSEFFTCESAEWEWDANSETIKSEGGPLWIEALELLRHWRAYDIYARGTVIGGRYPARKPKAESDG